MKVCVDVQPIRQISDSDGVMVHLLCGPLVTVDSVDRPVPEGSKRLLAFVALHGGRVERRQVAGTLWPSGGDARAAGNLRAALWRLRTAGVDVLVGDKWSLNLADGVEVDVRLISQWADRLIDDRPRPGDLAVQVAAFAALDLLPGWYDDWILLGRERLRQRMLHALEALSRRLTQVGRYADAVEAAITAIDAEPLRESAQRVLAEAHLGEGNWVEARRGYVRFREIMHRELGIEPSRAFSDLVFAAGGPRSSARPA